MNGRIRTIQGELSYIVNGWHVSKSDSEVIDEVLMRLEYSGGRWNHRERTRIIKLALAEHHRNQRTFRDIMGGI